jgi:peptidoglycan/LPS O-acetylase OafA/YrhL
MKKIRGAAVMALVWAAAWATIAVVVGLIVDPDGSMDEMWPAIGAYPGFLCGAVFSALLAFAERGLDRVTLSRAGMWGAVAGLLIGVLPFTIGESTSKLPVWLLAAMVIGAFTLLSAASAVASASWARGRMSSARA